MNTENGAVLKPPATENVKQSCYSCSPTGLRVTFTIYPELEHAGIYSRESNRGTHPDDDNHRQGKKNTVPQLWDLESIRKCRKHGRRSLEIWRGKGVLRETFFRKSGVSQLGKICLGRIPGLRQTTTLGPQDSRARLSPHHRRVWSAL